MLHPIHKHSLADRMNEWVHQPSFFAALVSVGLHGILFAALPSFSVDNSGLDDQRTVPVVELGAEEINRLPDFVELDEPLIPDTSNPFDLGLPPIDTFLNDLNTANSSDLDIDNLDSLDDLDLALENLTPLPSAVAPPPSTYKPPVLVPSTPPIVFNPAPIRPSSAWFPPPIQPIPIQPTNPVDDLDLDADSEIEVETETDPTATEPDTIESSGEEDPNQTTNPNLSSTPSDDPVSESNDPQEIAARPLTDEERITKLLAEYQEKQQSIDAASEPTFVTMLDQWLKTSPEDLRALELSPSYPKEACAAYRQNVEGIWIGVLVGDNNQVVADEDVAPNPEVLISSGSEFFDNKAKEAVTQITFEDQELANQQASYTVTVDFIFKEDDCPSIFSEMDNAVNPPSPDTINPPSPDTTTPQPTDNSGPQPSEAILPVDEINAPTADVLPEQPIDNSSVPSPNVPLEEPIDTSSPLPIPIDEPPINELPISAPPTDEPNNLPAGESSVSEPSVSEPSVDESSVDESSAND